jgi:hypothetical protein
LKKRTPIPDNLGFVKEGAHNMKKQEKQPNRQSFILQNLLSSRELQIQLMQIQLMEDCRTQP